MTRPRTNGRAELRTQGEYSHAANALVMLAAFCLATLSALAARE
jgi:hypothetical protein